MDNIRWMEQPCQQQQGGAVCRILVKARLQFNSVPTTPVQLAAFDLQMRDVHFNPEYAQAIVNDTDDANEVCTILAKQTALWTLADRQKLLSVVNEVCGGYP